MTTAALTLQEIEQHPDYRVLRRFVPRPEYGIVAERKVGVFADVESTGLNTDEDKIIQLALVRFEFDRAGNIGLVGPMYSGYEDPGVELSTEITEITGITDAMVKGKQLDGQKITDILAGADLMIAHNADFDRKMCEKRLVGIDKIAWACSQRDVKWEKFGCRGIKLDYLLMLLCGEFYDAHDALRDCLAGVHVLATPRLKLEQLEVERRELSPFQMLLDSVRQPTLRLYAWDSPYHTKDRLRLRRYRWYPDPVKCWAKDIKPDELEAERTWLLEKVYAGVCDYSDVKKISAYDRYSVRAS